MQRYEELNELGRRYAQGEEALRDEIIMRLQPGIHRIAHKILSGRGHIGYVDHKSIRLQLKYCNAAKEDLINDGNVALIDILKEFDPSRGQLLGFALNKVGIEMYKAGLERYGSIFTVNFETMQATRKEIGQPTQETAIQKIAATRVRQRAHSIGMSSAALLYANAVDYVSLDAIEVKQESTQEASAMAKERREHIDAALRRIARRRPRVAKVIERVDLEEMTKSELAREWGVGRERVRQLHAEGRRYLEKILKQDLL